MTKLCVLLVASTTLLALIVPAYSQDHEAGPTAPNACLASHPRGAGGQVFTSSMYGVSFVYPSAYDFEAEHYAGDPAATQL